MLEESTGNVLIKGVVDITTAQQTSGKPMDPSEVQSFMREIGTTLVSLVQTGSAPATETAPPKAVAAPAAVPSIEAPKASRKKKAAPQAVKEDVTVEAPAEPEAVVEVTTTPQGIRDRFPGLPTEPVIAPEKSIQGDVIVCLFDGAEKKMMSRHLRAKYNMSPDEYREYWNLSPDYPMTAPSYSAEKRLVALNQGLGTPAQRKKANAKGKAKAKTTRRTKAKATA